MARESFGSSSGEVVQLVHGRDCEIQINPEKYPLSLENKSFPYEIHELRLGAGRRKTHRAVFTIRPEMVLVIAVKHLAQQSITPDDV